VVVFYCVLKKGGPTFDLTFDWSARLHCRERQWLRLFWQVA